MAKINKDWTKLTKSEAKDRECDAVLFSGLPGCQFPVEWRYRFKTPDSLDLFTEPTFLYYCDNHKQDRYQDPKWWSLRTTVPTFLLKQLDYKAKAWVTAEQGCHTCSSLIASMLQKRANDMFSEAFEATQQYTCAFYVLEHCYKSHPKSRKGSSIAS